MLWLGLALLVVIGITSRASMSGHDSGQGAPPVPPGSRFFGFEVPSADLGSLAKVGAAVGCMPTAMSRFVKIDPGLTPDQLAAITSGGRTPVLTLEPWPWWMTHDQIDKQYDNSAIVEGKFDNQLRGIAQTLVGYTGRVFLRYAHEMNADWYPWGIGVNGNTAASYVRAWRHVHDVMSSIAPNILWVWAPAAGQDDVDLADVYPGDEYVDYVGVTGYGRPNESATAEGTFGDWYAAVRKITDKPAIISETGASGKHKVEWIRSLPDFLDEHRDIEGFIWFNTTPQTTGATGHYALDDSDSQRAFSSVIKRLGLPCG